jgi:azurin
VDNGLVSLCDNFLFFRNQCLKLFYLSDLSISNFVMTLSYTGQQTHTVAQHNLIVVLAFMNLMVPRSISSAKSPSM